MGKISRSFYIRPEDIESVDVYSDIETVNPVKVIVITKSGQKHVFRGDKAIIVDSALINAHFFFENQQPVAIDLLEEEEEH